MKNAQDSHTLKLSYLEDKVYNLIESSDSPTSMDIANRLFSNSGRGHKAISNSVTSIIRQINRKLEKHGFEYRIVGKARGPAGKTLSFETIK